MNLHLLRIYVAVVEQQSFSRAAAALYISQPAVSKAVRELEDQLSLPLLERGARRLQLTAAGRLLYERARPIFAIERSAEEELAAMRGLKRGVLRIGASSTVVNYFLPPLLSRFHNAHPEVELRVTRANTQTVVELLSEYRLDIALIEGPLHHEGMVGAPWLEDELVVICSPDNPLLARAPLPLDELARAPFLVREPGSGTREVAEEALHAHGIYPPTALELGSTEAIKQAVAAGLGLAVVSRAAAVDQLALGKLRVLEIRGLAIKRTFTRLTLAGRSPSPLAVAFDNLLDGF